MRTENFILSVNLPTTDEFGERFPQYKNFAENDGNFLFNRIISPESFINARVVTLILKLPAVAGIAEDCYNLVNDNGTVEWRGFIKQFIGAVVCKLMEDNGFQKTGRKKAIPHDQFTKGELYAIQNLHGSAK